MSSVIIRYVAPIAVMFMPTLSFAMDVVRTLGYLDIFIGLFLAVSVVMFVGAFIVYLVRYGTQHREDTFVYMHWSIAILFVLSVLLALIHFFQKHTSTMLYLLSIIVFVLLAVLIVYISTRKVEKKEDKRP